MLRLLILCAAAAAALLSETSALHVSHAVMLRAAPSASAFAMHLRGGLAEETPVAEDSPHVAVPDCDTCGKNYTLSGNLDTHELCPTCNNFFERDLPTEARNAYSVGDDGGIP
ncbi:hypothetical protein T484DRAFT_1753741 [Baffinella frigidus]|nr:hypothetical protein T484DRAFT_1753741 [Cryptophyta sp. CCMP2293]